MPLATTATASTIPPPLSTVKMSLLSVTEASPTYPSLQKTIDSPDAAMQPFTPGQCLLCPKASPSFADSVIHMQRSHGLFVPQQQDLAVDLETLFRYLHLVIFGYRECIQCGTERATVQAIQQHMTGKGHCKFDISGSDSEFSEFYDFSELQEGADSDVEANGEERNQQSSRKPLLADESSIRLPSGRVILRKSSVQAELSFSQLHRRNRTLTSRLEESSIEPDDEAGSSKDKLKSDKDDTRLISKREKREKAMVTYKLANMSANDRKGLIHLPAAQQRSILATQHRHMEKLQKEERRNQSHIERKGNKNLYAYWATETPVYQCG